MAKIERLPIAPETIQNGALTELEHVRDVVQMLSPNDWSRPSSVTGWTVGEVVAHLDLFIGMYGRFLGIILAGGAGSSAIANLIGWFISSILPSAAPVFDGGNAAIPKVMDRLLRREQLKRQFSAGAQRARGWLLQIDSHDSSRAGEFQGSAYPLEFYLGIFVNELALHTWDIEAAINDTANLSDAARAILPWFYWSVTRLMFRPPMHSTGAVQVVLTEPEAVMWWSMADGFARSGRATINADAEVRGLSGTFVLALSGRISPAGAMQSSLSVKGDSGLAEQFLGSWHLI
jgi:hypothetical protein